MSIVLVAKRAGVSIATVSRVLNDSNTVRARTVEQVRAAMQELNYTPPIVKRGPKSSGPRRALPRGMRTGQVAVVNLGGNSRWLNMPVMASAVAGVMRAAKEFDLTPVLDEMPDPSVMSPILRRREVDGAIVFVPSHRSEEFLDSLRAQLPVVWLMGGETGVPNVDHVSADNDGIGRMAFDYLASQGRKRLAFVSDNPGLQIMRIRGQSFGNAARDSGLSVTNFLVNVEPGEQAGYSGLVHNSTSLAELAQQIAAMSPRPDGVFICADRTTVDLYPLLLQQGVDLERELKIISCDNEHEQLAKLSPRPPSIDLNSDELGRWAVRQLMQRVQRPDGPPARIQVAPRIEAGDALYTRSFAGTNVSG